MTALGPSALPTSIIDEVSPNPSPTMAAKGGGVGANKVAVDFEKIIHESAYLHRT